MIFAIATIINVILSTIRGIITIKGKAWQAALINAFSYGFYVFVIALTSSDGLSLWLKALITFGANFVGVFIVKLIEDKLKKDKLWKVEFTVSADNKQVVENNLLTLNIPYYYNEYGKHTSFSAFCQRQEDTNKVADVVKRYNGKYFITENAGKLIF